MRVVQTILVLVALLAGVLLYFFARTTPPETSTYDVYLASEASFNTSLEEVEREVSGNMSLKEKDEYQNQMTDEEKALFWQKKDNASLSAHYLYKVAKTNNNFYSWETAGNAWLEVCSHNLNHSLPVEECAQRAILAFQKALEWRKNLQVKLKLANCYTHFTKETMKGVLLLREIVEEEPNNVQANYELGLLSLQSGQLEKAIQRFNAAINGEKDFVNAYVLKAEAYLQNKQKQEALNTLQQALAVAKDSETKSNLQNFIDNINNS